MAYVCGVREMIGDGSAMVKLQTNRPLYYIRDALPGFSRDNIAEFYEEAFSRWAFVCDLKTRRVHDLAEVGPLDVVNVVTVADLGGSGVLADQVLPNGTSRELRMRINSRITWRRTDGPMQGGTVDPCRTLAHEQGHALGMLHQPSGPPIELMDPTVSNTVIRPTPTEIKIVQAWFGLPKDGPPVPDPDPTPIPPDWTCCRAVRESLRVFNQLRHAREALTMPELQLTDDERRQLDNFRAAAAALPCAKFIDLFRGLCQPGQAVDCPAITTAIVKAIVALACPTPANQG